MSKESSENRRQAVPDGLGCSLTFRLNLSPLTILFTSRSPDSALVQLPLDRAGLHSLAELHSLHWLPDFAIEAGTGAAFFAQPQKERGTGP
jgi:hypothetical protein